MDEAPELIVTDVTPTDVVLSIQNPQTGYVVRLYEAEIDAGKFCLTFTHPFHILGNNLKTIQ
jgi:hypothetical protein